MQWRAAHQEMRQCNVLRKGTLPRDSIKKRVPLAPQVIKREQPNKHCMHADTPEKPCVCYPKLSFDLPRHVVLQALEGLSQRQR